MGMIGVRYGEKLVASVVFKRDLMYSAAMVE